ncbi:hypothetical protein [Nesterenkonia ebinurensis]|uniref:hypothetical protein n=1 Tax=Nesterenkonia ebinurensis TaxID=2608252 RepID=UPI00123D1079|nr:hypothetical protein [Nesterenkonia ebinurensis]
MAAESLQEAAQRRTSRAYSTWFLIGGHLSRWCESRSLPVGGVLVRHGRAGAFERVQQLDNAQKRELAYALFDEVNGDKVVTSYEAAVIDERLADLEANPDDEMSSEEFWKRIHSKLR